MLTLASIINYMDRAALSVAMPFISKDLDLNAASIGLILSSFSIGYALFNVVGGYLSDKIGPNKVFIGSMSLWSLFCGLVAGAFNFWSLYVVRVIFGMGEGPIGSTANKAVNNWFPIKERARAVGINQAGGPIGGALSGPIVGILAVSVGWRLSFVIIAVLGFIWLLFWLKIFKDNPADHPKVSKSELKEIVEGNTILQSENNGQGKKLPFLQVIKKPIVFTTGISLFCYNYILFFFLTWFPIYLVNAKGLNIKEMGFVVAIPWLVGAIGYISGGALMDYIYKITGKALFSRKIVLVTGLLISAVCIGLTGLVNSIIGTVTVMTIGVGFLYLVASGYWSIIQDGVESENVGSASGFMHGLGNISGIVAPAVTGFIVQSTDSYVSAFILTGVLGIIGALIIAFFVKNSKTQTELTEFPSSNAVN